MEFSTEFMQQITQLFTAELQAQLRGQTEVRIAEIETVMRKMLRQVGEQCLGGYLTAQDAQYPEPEMACACGGVTRYLFRRPAKVLSVFGWTEYRRAYYVCTDCHKGYSPLDARFGLQPGEVTAGLASLLAMAGVQTSFGEARQLVERFLLIEVSENTVRKESQAFGGLQDELEQTWITQSQDPQWLQTRQRTVQEYPTRLYGSLDGAHVPLNEEWRELKTGCWYEVETASSHRIPSQRRSHVGDLGALRAKAITYYSDIEHAQAFGALMWATGCQRCADLAREIVFVSDGAVWIWKLVEHYFPNAVQIVDWYHAESYLEPIAQEAFGADDNAAKAWLELVRTDLWEGRIDAVIQACQPFVNHPQAGTVAQKAVTYYTNNQHRLDYARFREAGYLIGSGTVESGCKQIVTKRLKVSGARWTEDGACATAKARASWLSGYWLNLSVRRGQLPLAI